MASVGKQHILIVVQNLPLPFDRRVWLEALTLTEAGYDVSIICPKGQHGKFQESRQRLENIDIYRYPAPMEAAGVLGYVWEFIYCWLMTAWLSVVVYRKRPFAVFHACNPPETYFLLAWFYQKLAGVKFLFDHHDLSPEMYMAKGGKKGSMLYRGLVWLEKMTFKVADVVITTNESHKQIAQSRGGVPEAQIFIVRTGPDFDRLQQLPAEPALKEGYPFLACYLGEMCEQDGVHYVLYAAEQLQKEYGRNDVKFVLMGGGPALKQLQALNEEMGLSDFVTFTGRVSDHDLCRYLSTADVCLDPDPYTEWADQSTMNKIMEYMAFAKPSVAFNLRENRFSAQEAALYATPNEVDEFTALLVQLLDDAELRQEMGTFGQQRVYEQLAWTYSKPFLLAAYHSILSERVFA